MGPRMNYFETSAKLSHKLVELGQLIGQGCLGLTIIDLVNIRASQLNGCAFCLDMHVKEAKIHGERELRLYHVAIWRESNLFNEKERACFELTEALTKLPEHGITNQLYEQVSKHLTELEISELAFAIGSINLWNRLNAAFLPTPGILDSTFGLTKANLK